MSIESDLVARAEAVLDEIENNRVTHWVHTEALALVAEFHKLFAAKSAPVAPKASNPQPEPSNVQADNSTTK